MKSLLNNISLIKKHLFWLIALSTITRGLLAWILDLGSNEAYYWTYGSYPELSHIDHPPMIGWFIQLFTVNLALDGELFLRLASIVTGSINTWLVFVIGRRVRNERTGLYAAFIDTASAYCSLFTGTFITPDTPQSLFLLLSVYFLHEGLTVKYELCQETKILCRIAILLAGIFIGLSMLSKYSSVFIWAGAIAYMVSSNRKILKDITLYISFSISLLFLLPVILWNIDNNFISFAFQSSRMPVSNLTPDLLSFIKSLGWILLYNNPLSISIMAFALFSFRRDKYLKPEQYKLFLSLSLPFLIFFIGISLFTESRPNWSAPGFYPLMFIAAAYLDNKSKIVSNSEEGIIPLPVSNSITLMLLMMLIVFVHHFSGFLSFDYKKEAHKEIGEGDITLNYFGWRTLSKEFEKIKADDVSAGLMPEKCFILSDNWAHASLMDFYVASPSSSIVKTIGNLEDTRKYAWVTGKLGTFRYGESAYFIESSIEPKRADEIGKRYFSDTHKARSVYIKKLGKPVLRFDIYRLKNMTRIPERELCSYTKY